MGTCLDKALLGLGGAVMSVGIDKLAEIIENAIQKARKPANDIPPLLTTIESKFRPGLSAISLSSNIVSRLAEAGVNTGTLPDGTEPQVTRVLRIFCEELVKEFQLNTKIQCEIPTGTNVGQAGQIPVMTTMPVLLNGVLQ